MYKDAPSSSKSNKLKGTRRRLRILFVVMLCFIGWAGLTLWDQIETVNAKSAKLSELEGKLSTMKELNEQYQLQIIRLNDPEYIEQLLRKELHMTKEGETLFIETK